MERGLDKPVNEIERIDQRRAAALALLAARGIAAGRAQAVWSRFAADYFARHSPDELAWHLEGILAANEERLPLILVASVDSQGTTVFVYTRDRDHLFGLTTGVLARLGLNILDARINTTADGYVLDSYVVIENDGKQIEDAHRFAEISEALHEVLSDPTISVVDVNRRRPQRLKHFNTPTNVNFSQDAARHHTILELVTSDQPGLLSMIGRVFHKRGILLDAAKINTIGARAEDVFFITDRDHQPITSEKMLDELREVLVRTLSDAEPARPHLKKHERN
jgi:[protein-PII] uridylyltransferase